jgi:hypothetical protein
VAETHREYPRGSGELVGIPSLQGGEDVKCRASSGAWGQIPIDPELGL